MKLRKVLTGIMSFAVLTAVSSNSACFAEWYDSERSCLERARTLFSSGQFDEAQKACDRGLAFNPNSAEIIYFRGVLNHTLKRYDLALADFDQAIKLNPTAGAYIARGTLYSNEKKYDLAVKDFDSALKLEPRNDSARTNKEFCLTEVENQRKLAMGGTEKSAPSLNVAVSTAVPIPVPKQPKAPRAPKEPREPKVSHQKDSGVAVSAIEDNSAELKRLTAEVQARQKESDKELQATLAKERAEKEALLRKLAEIKVASRTADKKATEVVKPEDRPVKDKWALIVGISKFKNNTLNLKYPSKDAKDFYDYLVADGKFQKDHVKLLLDEQATRGNILSEL
ncbi:MAG: tetratricopeptide repeat protein, partial [Leptolyngbya sp.]|nr:tetratricopeptide repeat protein [Candidatus Melainabacteria bacterium]